MSMPQPSPSPTLMNVHCKCGKLTLADRDNTLADPTIPRVTHTFNRCSRDVW
jgi:hypothetical protein